MTVFSLSKPMKQELVVHTHIFQLMSQRCFNEMPSGIFTELANAHVVVSSKGLYYFLQFCHEQPTYVHGARWKLKVSLHFCFAPDLFVCL